VVPRPHGPANDALQFRLLPCRRRAPSPRLRGEGWGEGDPPLALTYRNRVLIGAFSGRFADVALNGFCGGVQCFHIWRRDHRVNEGRDDQAQEAPSAVFYAASRWGESPRWSATRGSVNSASNRLQRMWAFALLASSPGGPARPTPLLRCLKAISMRHRNR
jgi:hypothetical protein